LCLNINRIVNNSQKLIKSFKKLPKLLFWIANPL
jgi:hypothetical protein